MHANEAAELPRRPLDVGAPPIPFSPPELGTAPALVIPARETSVRLANIERLRILAMLEIVTFHVGSAVLEGGYRLPLVGGLGLPAFLLLNNAFNCTLTERMGARAFLDAKVSKLLLPWAAWSLVYGVIVLGEKLRHHEPLSEAFSPWMLVGGTYIHLWFVPFALLSSLVVAGLQRRTSARSHVRMAAAGLAAGAVLVLGNAWLLKDGLIDWPVKQWLFALPAPLLGFALGRVLLARDRRLLWRCASSLAVAGALVLALSLSVDVPPMLRRYAASLVLVSLFFLFPGSLDRVSRQLTPLLFGVYLIHPLVLRVYQALHLPFFHVALDGALLFVASAAIVEGLRRTPLRRLI